MAAQTKFMVRIFRILLLPMQDYKREAIITDNILFSTCMMDLTERPEVAIIVNQVTQINLDYNCSFHIPLWLKLVKINGFLAPIRVWFGGFWSWLFQLGNQTISEDQNNNRLKKTANLEGEGTPHVKNYNKVLGSIAYTEPKIIEDAIKMLVAVLKTTVELTGNQPRIASTRYTYAAVLMGDLDQPIEENMNHIDIFLVRLLHNIDREVQLAFLNRYTRHRHQRLASKKASSPTSISKLILSLIRSSVIKFPTSISRLN